MRIRFRVGAWSNISYDRIVEEEYDFEGYTQMEIDEILEEELNQIILDDVCGDWEVIEDSPNRGMDSDNEESS